MRERFLAALPDFEESGAFAATTGRYHDTFRTRVDALLAAAAAHPGEGWAVMRDVLAASQGNRGALPPFFDGDVSWRVPRARDVDAARLDAALDALIGGSDDPPAAIAAFTEAFQPLLEAIGQGNAFRDTRVVPATVLAAVAPHRAISVRYTPYGKAERLLNDRTLFRNKPITAEEYRAVLALAEQIRSAMVDWGWAPRDLWDVHGFILTAMARPDEAGGDTSPDDTPIWIVTARDRAADGVAGFVERGEWHLAEDRASRSNELVREMRVGDRIVLRDFIPRAVDPPFDTGGKVVTALRIRATGVINEQRGDGLSVGVRWDPPVEPRLWYFYTRNYPVWRLRTGDEEMARRLAAFIFDGEPQDHDWFAARWFTDAATEERTVLPDPTNLILYGPPGTGKTYATAAHAVRLCDGLDDDDPLFRPERRDALMARYRQLVADERIEFVTFHQSVAYEEFVEGLRPSSLDEEGQPLAAGFRLAPTPGIFRTVARRAEMSTGSGDASFSLGDRKVFKMSIGEASNPDDAHLFEEAIAGGYTLLGFGDTDWSDPRFADRQAIIDAVRADEGDDRAVAGSGRVQMPHIFRNWMRVGDLVIVSKGNSLFRAIGEITGDYAYAPRDGGDYPHRRAVRWLWVDRAGVPVNEIYAQTFSMKSVYALTTADLNIPALGRYANSRQKAGHGLPEPFVLVIDEINRANISKVFGELITLLEADKRIGKGNELRVRLPYSKLDFGVPANLHIVGTMNTADRSIALIDKALRRRFTFIEVMPDYSVPGMEAEVGGVTLAELLRTINERIEYLLDREHQIGHGWLLGCDTRASLDAAMRNKIIPLIAEYFFEDWGRTADVLGGRGDNPFLEQQTLTPPPGMAGAEPRIRWSVRESFAADAYRRLIG